MEMTQETIAERNGDVNTLKRIMLRTAWESRGFDTDPMGNSYDAIMSLCEAGKQLDFFPTEFAEKLQGLCEDMTMADGPYFDSYKIARAERSSLVTI